MIEKKNILGVGITNAAKEEILEYIVKNLEKPQKKLFFVTPNPEFLVLASKNPAFKNVLNKADLASADGIGVLIAAKILGQSLKGRFTGVGLVESLCEKISASNAADAEKPITMGFLGGRGNVAEKTADCLRLKYPKLKIVFVGQEWPIDGFTVIKGVESRIKNQESRMKTKNSKIHNSLFMIHNSIDILFVAFGAPKQEMWIAENLDKIPVRVAIGVGGAFDYISGEIPRAPKIIRDLGFEWLFRLVVQPWRIKRQLALLEFVWLVIKEKLTKN